MNYKKRIKPQYTIRQLTSGGTMVHVPFKLLVNKHSNYLGEKVRSQEKKQTPFPI